MNATVTLIRQRIRGSCHEDLRITRPAGRRRRRHRHPRLADHPHPGPGSVNPILLPLAAAQGLWLRATLKPAPEAGGATNGTAPGVSGTPLRLAVVGDSTAAGCGVTHHTEGFAAALAQRLAADTGRP